MFISNAHYINWDVSLSNTKGGKQFGSVLTIQGVAWVRHVRVCTPDVVKYAFVIFLAPQI